MVLLGDEAQVLPRFGPLGDSVILMQDRCTVCIVRTICSEIILVAPNVHLGDEAQLVARFSPFGDTVSVSASYAHGLRQTYHKLRNGFGRTRWYS